MQHVANFIVIVLRCPRSKVGKGNGMIRRPFVEAEVILLSRDSCESSEGLIDNSVNRDLETAPPPREEVGSVARREEKRGDGLRRLKD